MSMLDWDSIVIGWHLYIIVLVYMVLVWIMLVRGSVGGLCYLYWMHWLYYA